MKIRNYDYETVEDNMPYRQSMRKSSGERKSSGYDSWDDDFPRHEYRNYVDRFIEKNIGNNFDEVFSKLHQSVKRRHLSTYDANNEIAWFKCNFERKCYHNGDYYEYYVDSKGNIKKGDYEKRKHKDITLYTECYEMYKIKSTEYDYMLYKAIGKTAYNQLSEYAPAEYYRKYRPDIQKMCDNINDEEHRRYNWIYPEDFFLIDRIYDGEIVLKYRSVEYRRYIAEKNDALHKEHRERIKHMEEVNANMLYYVESLAKRRFEEENNAKIIKHGFDPKTSFRNVPLKETA